MEYNKAYFEKVFSTKRMERYFNLYPGDEKRAILHYQCNLELAEAFYTSLSVFEVTLRNALCRELETMTGTNRLVCRIPDYPRIGQIESLHHTSHQADFRKTRNHYSSENCSRIDIRLLGIVTQQ